MKNISKLVLCGLLALFLALPLAQAEDVVSDEQVEEKSPWKANTGLNAVINTGNSENQTVGGSALIGWKEAKNAVQWTAKGAYGRSEVDGVTDTTTNNFRTELRYDRFFVEVLSGFVLGHIGYDKPAGFDLRTGAALGYSHTLISGPPHTFSYELGPDFTHEERTDSTSDDIISGRVALKYGYDFNENVKFTEVVETLINFEDSEDTRIDSQTNLTVKLTDLISFQAGFNLRVDFQPVAGFEEVDTTTTFGLLFDII